MADIAQLGFAIDSSQANTAAANLDKMTEASARAEAGSARVVRQAQATADSIRQVGEQAQRAAGVTSTSYDAMGASATSFMAIAREVDAMMGKEVATLGQATAARALYNKALEAGVMYQEEYAAAMAVVDKQEQAIIATQAKQAAAVEKLAASYIGGSGAAEKLAADQAKLDEALAAGTISQERYAAASAALAAEQRALSSAFAQVNFQTSFARQEFGRMGADALSGQWTRLDRSAVTLAGHTGILNAAFAALTSVWGILIGVAAAVAAGIAYFVVRLIEGHENIEKFNQALASTNDYAGMTAKQLNDLAVSIAVDTVSYKDSAEAVLYLARSGKVAGDTLVIAAQGAAAFANLSGESIKQTVKEYENLAGTPTQTLLKLNDQTHLLDASTIALVSTVESSGNKFAAGTIAVQAFAAATEAARVAQEQMNQKIAELQSNANSHVMGAMAADMAALNGTLAKNASLTQAAVDAQIRLAQEQAASKIINDAVNDSVGHLAVALEQEKAKFDAITETVGKGRVGLAEYTIEKSKATVQSIALAAAETAFTTALKNGVGIFDAGKQAYAQYNAAVTSGMALIDKEGAALLASAKAADAATEAHKKTGNAVNEAMRGLQQLDAEVNKLTGEAGGAAAKAWSDYVAEIDRLDLAYAKAITGGRNLAQAQALLQQGVIAATANFDKQSAAIAKSGDVLGKYLAQAKNDAAFAALSPRAQAVAKAVSDMTEKWYAAAAAGKPMADSLQFVQAAAAATAGPIFDMNEKTSELNKTLSQFGQGNAFDKLTEKLKDVQDELKKVGDANSKAFDPKRAKELEDATGNLKQSMLEYATGAIGQGISALQNMAGQGTKAYKELEVAQDALNLVTAIGAIVNQGIGDPYTAFARIAAMAAIMAKLVGDIGSIGGSSGPSADSAQVRQQTQGTGTVLGDAKAQSDSIAKAVAITASATSELVGINRGMLNALQSLQAALGNAGTQLAQGAGNATFPALSGGNAFNNLLSSADPLGGDPITKAIGNLLFGGSKKVIDQGIVIAGGTLQDMLNKIVVGAYQTVHTSGGLFSSGSTKDSVQNVSDEFTKQFQLVIQSISDAVKQGATALGILPADIQAAMDKFKIAETHISLQGLSAEDQQKALEAVFSQIFDNLAGAVVPYIGQFQKVGEGLGETLIRVATEVQVTQEAVKQLGFAINTTDPEKFAQVADGLANAMGGVENFITGMKDFTSKFASDGDKFKYEQDSLNSAFGQLGLVLPTTREGMMDLMHSLDASTASGQKAIATLLQLAGVADAYYTDLEKQAQAKKDYDAEVRGLDLKIGNVSPIIDQLQQIRQWSIDESAKLNALAKSAGMAGAAESDLAKVQIEAAQEAAAAIAALKQSATDLAVKLGYTDNLDSLNAKIAALQAGAGYAAAGISGAAASITAAGDALNLEIGDLSPYSDQKKLDLALQGLRAGTVSADQVLQIGRRLYASGDDYNKLFEQVLSIHPSAGGVTGGDTGGGSGNSAELAALIAQRDALEKQQRQQDAQQLAQKIADLAQAEHESVQDVAKEVGANLDGLAKDLGIGNDKIADYLNGLQKQDVAGTFVDSSGHIIDAVTSGSDAVVYAIYDAAGKTVPASATRPVVGTNVTPSSGPAPSTGDTGGGGSGGGSGGGGRRVNPGDGNIAPANAAAVALLGNIADSTSRMSDRMDRTERHLSDLGLRLEALARA